MQFRCYLSYVLPHTICARNFAQATIDLNSVWCGGCAQSFLPISVFFLCVPVHFACLFFVSVFFLFAIRHPKRKKIHLFLGHVQCVQCVHRTQYCTKHRVSISSEWTMKVNEHRKARWWLPLHVSLSFIIAVNVFAPFPFCLSSVQLSPPWICECTRVDNGTKF